MRRPSPACLTEHAAHSAPIDRLHPPPPANPPADGRTLACWPPPKPAASSGRWLLAYLAVVQLDALHAARQRALLRRHGGARRDRGVLGRRGHRGAAREGRRAGLSVTRPGASVESFLRFSNGKFFFFQRTRKGFPSEIIPAGRALAAARLAPRARRCGPGLLPPPPPARRRVPRRRRPQRARGRWPLCPSALSLASGVF